MDTDPQSEIHNPKPKKRIAFFGPMNPTPSGISDYDEELLPLLRREYEIDVLAMDDGSFYERNNRYPYDLCVYQLGNALLHEYMYSYLFQYPGAVVFHDYCLHHSRAKMLLQRGYFDEYFQEAARAHPENPAIAKMVSTGIAGDLLLYFYPLVRLVLESSLAAGAHTRYVSSRLRISQTPVFEIPMYVAPNAHEGSHENIRALYPEELVLASFGLVTPEKRI